MSLQNFTARYATGLPGSGPFRRDLLNWPPTARSRHSHGETGRHQPVRASSRIVAATLGKFYHGAGAGAGYPAAQAPGGLSSFESSARILASATRPPAAPEIQRTGCARPPEERVLAPPRPDRSAPQTAAGRR